ncbi:hypothetical protein C8R43DRAFT_1119178 [Mycena crocata]|nr:hypothetical protein C8R43DRAFT_1119178 [Mycena crocata]
MSGEGAVFFRHPWHDWQAINSLKRTTYHYVEALRTPVGRMRGDHRSVLGTSNDATKIPVRT